jgi:hypothetical protein
MISSQFWVFNCLSVRAIVAASLSVGMITETRIALLPRRAIRAN